jgi:hypothetical protein
MKTIGHSFVNNGDEIANKGWEPLQVEKLNVLGKMLVEKGWIASSLRHDLVRTRASHQWGWTPGEYIEMLRTLSQWV